jgi:hypothetical protein
MLIIRIYWERTVLSPSRFTVDTIKKNTDTLIHASKKVVLEIILEKGKYVYMLLPNRQNAGQMGT